MKILFQGLHNCRVFKEDRKENKACGGCGSAKLGGNGSSGGNASELKQTTELKENQQGCRKDQSHFQEKKKA